jgi:hypothetical protein
MTFGSVDLVDAVSLSMATSIRCGQLWGLIYRRVIIFYVNVCEFIEVVCELARRPIWLRGTAGLSKLRHYVSLLCFSEPPASAVSLIVFE